MTSTQKSHKFILALICSLNDINGTIRHLTQQRWQQRWAYLQTIISMKQNFQQTLGSLNKRRHNRLRIGHKSYETKRTGSMVNLREVLTIKCVILNRHNYANLF